jgi:flagellar hook protein FlgE
MAASETMIDVAGNNVANANTVGFKASNVEFATQFSQTLSVGTAPSDGDGGSDPVQTGLGVEVASVDPDFSQGTLQTTSDSADLAIQGDGFFAVQTAGGQQLYTRDGQFKLNSQNQLTDASGNLVLGYGVDSSFNIQATQLQALSIPLGSTAVAHATQNVTMEGTLSATGTVATTAQIIQTGSLGDASYSAPASGTTVAVADTPNTTNVTTASSTGTGGLSSSAQYQYEFVFEDANGTTQSTPSAAVTVTTGATDNTVTLSNLPTDSNYSSLQIYRTDAGGSTFKLLTTISNPASSYTDTTSDATLDAGTSPPLNTTELTGDYSYYVTFANVPAGNDDANGNPLSGVESRPTPVIGPVDVVNGRIQLNNLPVPDGTQWQSVRIYRNTASDPTDYQLVSELPYNASDPTQNLSFTDNVSDAVLQGTAAGMTAPRQSLNMTGPPATSSTLLTNLLQNNGGTSQSLFQVGTLTYTGEKGANTLTAQSLKITSTTTVQDLLNFIDQADGIQSNNASTAANPIPNDSSGAAPGATINAQGEITIVSNNGQDNAVSINPSAFQLTTASGTTTPIDLPFNTTQQAVGNGAIANFVVYDSLGEAINVRVTAELQSQTSSETTYRWYADSSDNQPGAGVNIAVGTGLISFDGQGNFISATNDTVSVDRSDTPATSPLNFNLNFSALSGLSATASSLNASGQDGFPPGQLTSFNISSDGTIQGVFDNGTQRNLGQVQLARFANPDGLVQQGQNLFAAGVNSGLPVIASPSSEGIGSIVSGAVELSNTDISASLITLISASTMYRGNSEVISTANQLWTALLNLQQA